MEPQRVSAAAFIRGFANWRMQAAREPVVVTHHGKDAHVLISLDDYRRLDGEGAAEVADLQQSLAGLVESIRDGVILIDRQWRIAAINPAASDMTEVAAARLLGEDIRAALPRLASNILLHHLVRLIDFRERFAGDLPAIFRLRQWLHVELVPVPVGGAIILRDVSEAMDHHAAADARQAMANALEAHGTIGHARLSVRETVEVANDALTALVGVDAAAIRRVRFSALLALGQRQAFAEALESVFRAGAPVRIASEMVTRDRSTVGVTLSIAEIRGPYASDGAIVLVTPR